MLLASLLVITFLLYIFVLLYIRGLFLYYLPIAVSEVYKVTQKSPTGLLFIFYLSALMRLSFGFLFYDSFITYELFMITGEGSLEAGNRQQGIVKIFTLTNTPVLFFAGEKCFSCENKLPCYHKDYGQGQILIESFLLVKNYLLVSGSSELVTAKEVRDMYRQLCFIISSEQTSFITAKKII